MNINEEFNGVLFLEIKRKRKHILIWVIVTF